jgi:ABC-type transport system involved in multi-copper enzyme maturation permease subunit
VTDAAVAQRRSAGVIHDLGYARYAGERRSPSTLWRVIMRHQISQTWKTWWRWKPALIGAIITTVSAGLVMYLAQNKVFDVLRSNAGAVRFLDGTIPLSIEFFRMCAFVVTMTVGSTTIARDRETGAFGFYFCRPVRARDYVLGKLAGMTIVMATIMLAGPVLLALFRIGLAKNSTEMVHLLPWLGRVVLIGVAGSLVYASLPLAISSLIDKRWTALGVWAGYWIPVTTIFKLIGFAAWGPMLAFDPGAVIDQLGFRLWGLDSAQGFDLPMIGVAISVIGHTGVAIAILYWRVSREAAGAVGAGS